MTIDQMLEKLPDKIRSRIRVSKKRFYQGTPCWIWTGHRDIYGYGKASLNGEPVRVHRLTYTLFIGEIPPEFEVHHKCKIEPCANPLHLEALTRLDHAGKGFWASRKSCSRGHEYTEESTRITSSGSRFCLLCKKQYDKERHKEIAMRLRGYYGRQPVTSCIHGHPYTEENTIHTAMESVQCRTCTREAQRRRRAQARENDQSKSSTRS
jgi:hypothetical protein